MQALLPYTRPPRDSVSDDISHSLTRQIRRALGSHNMYSVIRLEIGCPGVLGLSGLF